MGIHHNGPSFQIESDDAFILLGVSERREVGEFFARTLDERGLFENIDIVPISKLRKYERKGLKDALKTSTAITHSAGIIGVREALQVVAINPPEPVSLPRLVKRAMIDLPKEEIAKEEGSHETGLGDMLKAGFEIIRSLRATGKATLAISGGYSATERLIHGAEDFPAGRAMVHSELDLYGFATLANLGKAAANGVTTVMLPEHYHNEILFAPNATIDQLTPAIFPET